MSSFAERSLCPACAFARRIEGRRGQVYLLCESRDVPHKYPAQPVVRCAAYVPPDPRPASGTMGT